MVKHGEMKQYYIYTEQNKMALAEIITSSFDKAAKAYYKSGNKNITVRDTENNARVYYFIKKGINK